jgi:adenine-specific DNA methylase
MNSPDNDFPATAVSLLSRMENAKRQYYRPIYSLHKWWARRTGAVFRSIGLFAMKEDKKSILEVKQRSVDPNSPYFLPNRFPEKIVLDPFMGGGTTIVEMARMGTKVVGVDLNPLAWWIVKEEIAPADLDNLHKIFGQLEQTVGKEITDYYTTTCKECGSNSAVIYYFWSSSLLCQTCGKEVFLFNICYVNKGLSRTAKEGNAPLLVCPKCLTIFFESRTTATCPNCGYGFDPRVGVVENGTYTCIHCGTSHRTIDTLKERQAKLSNHLYAIEYYCEKCNEKKYKAPDQYDLGLYERAYNEFEEQKGSLLIPHQKIPPGRDTARVRNHNFIYFSDLFNKRQLLCLSKLLNSIVTLPDSHEKDLLLTTFSNALEYNNMLVPYNYPYRKIHHLFTHHAMPVTTRPVENNVWGCAEHGAGSFVMVFQRTLNAKKYINRPFEKFKAPDGNIRTVYIPQERINVKFATEFCQLKDHANALLLCKDSRSLLEIPCETIDYVITDPPYFDNINYSELSNFFYVWLRLALRDRISYFAPEYVPKLAEIVCDENSGKSLNSYEKGLTDVFKVCHGVLKSDGKLFFTYHHTSAHSWGAILNAIDESGFEVEDAFVVESETKFSPHLRGKTGIQFDAIIECGKWQTSHEEKISIAEFEERLYHETLKALRQTARGFSRLRESDFLVFISAECFKIYSQCHGKIFDSGGKRLSMQDLFKRLNNIREKLRWPDILPISNDMNPLTFIYTEFLSQGGIQKGELESILKQYGGLAPSEFIENRLIWLIHDKVNPVSPYERFDFLNKKIENDQELSLIDKTHYLIAQNNEKIRLRYISLWNRQKIKEISDRLYLKTGNPNYGRLSQILESPEFQRGLLCFR